MRLYRLKDECFASTIIERHGFVDSTPEVGLVSSKIWKKDGKLYRFTGWENTPKTALMANNPKYVNIEPIN